MIAMRLCAALAVVLVALVVVTVKAWPRRHARIGTPDVEVATPPRPEIADRAPPGFPSWRASPPGTSRSLPAIAHLRGRALLPTGRSSANDLADLFVKADDGRRSFPAATRKGGAFEFHMPPGRYILTAYAGDLVGELRDILVPTEGDREVEIALGASARISGRLRAPDRGFVDVVARPTGGGRPATEGNVDSKAGTYVVGDLIPGRRYDLEFSGDGVRTLELVGVTAPLEAMDVALERRALIRVDIGFPRGQHCPIDRVRVRKTGAVSDVGGDDGELLDPIGFQCRFEEIAPLDAGDITIVAEGDGWLLETQATIPAHGDLPTICLNPPCRNDPLELLAGLLVVLDGIAEDSPMRAEIVPVDDSEGNRWECDSSANGCGIEGLSPGKTFQVTAFGNRCTSGPARVTVAAGENELRLGCRR